MSTIPATVKALVASPEGKAPSVVEIPFGAREAVKNLGPQYVAVSNRALGLNPTDWKHAIGPWNPKKPYVTGCDSVGSALKVGSDVKHIKEGDRVAGFVFGCSNEEQGAYSEGLVFDSAVSFVLPPGMSDVEGAAFPIPHLNAVQALYMRLNLAKPSAPDTSSPKQTILIWGGSTAVGHHAVQLAALSGYRVFTTASPANHARLVTLGASKCFDYKDENVVEAIKKAAGEEGIFAAFDTACEKGSTDLCVDAIGPKGGRVITTLPVSDETAARRKDVEAGFTLVYTLLGYALTFGNTFPFPAMPEDNARSLDWVSNELPSLLAGWKEGAGSAKYQGQKLRVLEGHLDRVNEGLEIMKQGAYQAEKLVYQLV